MTLVGITARVDASNEHKERRDCVDQRWFSFLSFCGIQAVVLPNTEASLSVLPHLDGGILSGGNTLVKYGGDAPERDRLETKILSWATIHKFPLMGVCRGMQLMMDYGGEKLIETPSHVAQTHSITFTDTDVSRLVNSYHAFGSKTVPEGYEVCARAEDGIVEAMKHTSLPMYGIMYHPEREENFVSCDIDLFRKIFND